jgi:hypothetical protein
MALNRRARWALGAAAAVAVLTPALLLIPVAVPAPPRPAAAAPPLAPPPLPPPGALYRRMLFGVEAAPAVPGDAPELLGIVGRIDADAVAMVRAGDGSTRSLRPGESVDGWRLEALAADAASFVRGNETVRVAVAGEEAPSPEE